MPIAQSPGTRRSSYAATKLQSSEHRRSPPAMDATVTHNNHSPPISHEVGARTTTNERRGKEVASSPYIGARGFLRTRLPAHVEVSPSRASPRQPPHRGVGADQNRLLAPHTIVLPGNEP
jgi:hypothetical protein